MPTLKDIGGGIQVIAPSSDDAQSPMELVKSQLSLVDLANRVQAAPLDQKIKEVEFALKGNQLLNIDIDNETKRVDLISKQNDEGRKAAKFFQDSLVQLPGVLGQNFELGRAVLQKSIPGSDAAQNADGTFTVAIPTPKGTRAFTLDPKQVADPEKRATISKQFRDEWRASAKDFGVQSQYFNNMKNLATKGTSQADIGIVFSYMKLLDPGSTVREGEQATAQNAPGVTDRIRNMYNRALTEDAPLFGPAGSATRSKFIDAGKVLYDTSYSNTKQTAESYRGIIENQGLNARDALIPIGGVDFLKSEQPEAPPAPPGASGRGAEPRKPGQVAPGPKKSALQEFNEILGNNLFAK